MCCAGRAGCVETRLSVLDGGSLNQNRLTLFLSRLISAFYPMVFVFTHNRPLKRGDADILGLIIQAAMFSKLVSQGIHL